MGTMCDDVRWLLVVGIQLIDWFFFYLFVCCCCSYEACIYVVFENFSSVRWQNKKINRMRIKITRRMWVQVHCCSSCEQQMERLSKQHLKFQRKSLVFRWIACAANLNPEWFSYPKERRLEQQLRQLDERMVSMLLDGRMVSMLLDKLLDRRHERWLVQRNQRMVMSKFLREQFEKMCYNNLFTQSTAMQHICIRRWWRRRIFTQRTWVAYAHIGFRYWWEWCVNGFWVSCHLSQVTECTVDVWLLAGQCWWRKVLCVDGGQSGEQND